jgi:hypothetical protein
MTIAQRFHTIMQKLSRKTPEAFHTVAQVEDSPWRGRPELVEGRTLGHRIQTDRLR